MNKAKIIADMLKIADRLNKIVAEMEIRKQDMITKSKRQTSTL